MLTVRGRAVGVVGGLEVAPDGQVAAALAQLERLGGGVRVAESAGRTSASPWDR